MIRMPLICSAIALTAAATLAQADTHLDRAEMAARISELSYDLDPAFNANGPVDDYWSIAHLTVQDCDLTSHHLVFSDSSGVTIIVFQADLRVTDIVDLDGLPYRYSYISEDAALGTIRFTSDDSLRTYTQTVPFEPGATPQDYLAVRAFQRPPYKLFEHVMTFTPSEEAIAELAQTVQSYKDTYCG